MAWELDRHIRVVMTLLQIRVEILFSYLVADKLN